MSLDGGADGLGHDEREPPVDLDRAAKDQGEVEVLARGAVEGASAAAPAGGLFLSEDDGAVGGAFPCLARRQAHGRIQDLAIEEEPPDRGRHEGVLEGRGVEAGG